MKVSKYGLLGLGLFILPAIAQAQGHHVKGWHSCIFGQSDYFYYQTRDVEDIHDAPNCDIAFEMLRLSNDPCKNEGGRSEKFRKVSCEVLP